MSGDLPLQGITVVSLEQAAAPLATRHLADLGARVIKVERPGEGDFARGYDEAVHGDSSHFVWLNRSKESLTLDVKHPAGQAIVHQLIGQADVLVQNPGPGAAARLGLGAATLARAHPSLITCAITGWGSDGPWAGRKAYDLLVQCEVGLASLTGTAEHMAKAGISVADIAAGMYAYSGILTALLRRATTGVASAIEVSLCEALAEWMGFPAHYTAGAGRQPARSGLDHATIAPYGPYPTADGIVLMAIQNEREWISLCQAILGDASIAHDARFATNSARVEHRVELNELLGAAPGQLDTPTATGILDRAGIASARINQIRDFLDHPVLAARDRWREVAVPGGTMLALKPPTGMSGARTAHDRVHSGPMPSRASWAVARKRSLTCGAKGLSRSC
jgi:itaconate CoA-transferase